MGVLQQERRQKRAPSSDSGRRAGLAPSARFTPPQALMSPEGVLSLQRLAGNQATTGLIQQSRRSPIAVQRVGPGAQLKEREQPNPEEEIQKQVGSLPELSGEAPAPEKVEKAKDQAGSGPDELAEMGLGRSVEYDEWLRQQMGGGAGAEEAEAFVVDAQGVQEEADEPEAPQPTRMQRARKWLGESWDSAGKSLGGAWDSAGKSLGAARDSAGAWFRKKGKGIGKFFKRTFSREGARDTGPKGLAGGGVGASVAGSFGQVESIGGTLVDNPATTGAAHLVGGSGAAGKVTQLGSNIGNSASSATTGAPTLEHPGEFAQSMASGGFDLAHAIASVVGLFFSALKAAVDIKSLWRSVKVIRALKQAKRTAIAAGQVPEEIVNAIDYAIRQKYEKVVKRAIGAAAALAALGVGLAILIANPVGAGLAALIIGAVGAAVTVYKLGRWLLKSEKGVKRKKMAQLLYRELKAEDALAVAAVRSLNLDPKKIASDPDGVWKIARKLKSA